MDSLDHMSLLRSLFNHIGPLGYTYFVPTGRGPVFLSCSVITYSSNTERSITAGWAASPLGQIENAKLLLNHGRGL